MTIRKLPSVLINQIAAGEVVDRPASIVKELVENAIDAGSTRVEIALENGGIDSIRVSDNGSGIAPEEIKLAVTPHATSKIEAEEDLAAIASLGFRGEALASIGSISHLILTTRRITDESSIQIEVDGGSMSHPKPVAGNAGTKVEIKRLFFNTPARRKFLKSSRAETARVSEVVKRLASSYSDIGFTLISGGHTLLEYPPVSQKERLVSIFGTELDGEMIEINGSAEGMRLWGLVGTPDTARPTSRHIRVHINGRSIQDSSITHALKEAYRGFIQPKRWPTAALFVEIEPGLVDVNVHPQKNEVRFRNKDLIWRLVNKTIASVLLKGEFIPAYKPGEGSGMSTTSKMGQQAEFGSGVPFGFQEVLQPVEERIKMESPLPTLLHSDGVLQVHKCFLVTQDAEGILIIDQHALHERLMFEEFMQRLSKGNLESQRLLVPESVDVDAGQLEALEEQSDLFQKLGIDLSVAGATSILVHALPTLLVSRRVDGSVFIRELLDKLGANDFPSSEEEALAEIVDMMSCKAAVKAGDYLSTRELDDLLKKREEIERSGSCPHGRPTTMRLSIEELEKRFGRR